MSVDAAAIAEILGGPAVLGRPIKSLRDLDAAVRGGIPKLALDRLISFFAPPDRHRYLGAGLRNKIVPRATYQRAERLNPQVSETTERIARLYALALSAFQDPDLAARFMMRPHPELDDRVPFDAALTEIGGREVEEVIERGLHGLPA